MFISVEIEDDIKISPAISNFEETIIKQINLKYTNRTLKDLGLAIKLYKINKIIEYKIVEGWLLAKVRFQMLFFKLFKNEVIVARISKQDENGIHLYNSLFSDIWVSSKNLPSSSEKTYIVSKDSNRKYVIWYWPFKDNKLYFKYNDIVRFKIYNVEYAPFKIEGQMYDSGLGPITWWS